jgi:putative nucleotidyltransferase with HDIG domain
MAALSEAGQGFSITACAGSVVFPLEATTLEAVLRTADRRMYEKKRTAHDTAARKRAELLLDVLRERQPALAFHSDRVVSYAEAAARRLGLDEGELELVRLAGALHDVGKTAIPEEILNKTSSLTDEEWTIVKRHTVVGERLVSGSPVLSDLATVVRRYPSPPGSSRSRTPTTP